MQLQYDALFKLWRKGKARWFKKVKRNIVGNRESFTSCLDLEDYPNSVVDVFIELPQTEAGSRCAGICAASMALADAGLEMKDLVCAVSVGKVDDKLLVDLDYSEESYKDGLTADIPIAMLVNSGKVTLLQMDGEAKKQELMKLLEMGKKACFDIYEIQKKALKEKYQ